MSDLAFLFKAGRRERLSSDEPGPTEFFYGYVELRQSGMSVDMIDERAFDFDKPMGPLWTALTLICVALFGVHAWAVRGFHQRMNLLASARTVVAVNNSYGIALSYLRMRGQLPSNVIFLAMGLVGARPPPWVRFAYSRILRDVTLAVISRAEQQHLTTVFPNIKLHYVPFGVDHRFWIPGPRQGSEPYVLSVGNDPHRDYGTLVRAWNAGFPQLKIVTKLAVPENTCGNIIVVAGDWRTQRLSDAELREMVQCSRFVVIPVRETLQPSGQSACLQAMACGKAVILSDIAGLWDQDLMRDGENCVLVPPGDASAMRRAIQSLLDDPDRAAAIGRAARCTVEKHFNMDAMTGAMRKLCLESHSAVAVE